jgi:hypothetical protein
VYILCDSTNDNQNVVCGLVTSLQAAGAALVVVPQVETIDWRAVATDVTQPIVITNRPSQALRLCQSGQPAIAVIGMSERAVQQWLRDRGANVKEKKGAH